MRHTVPATVVAVLLACAAAAAATPSAQNVRKADRETRAGLRLLQHGDVVKAEEHFGKAVEAVPSYPDAHVQLGNIRMSRKDFEGALREYRAAEDGYAEMGAALQEIRHQNYLSAQRKIVELQDSLAYLSSPQQANKTDEATLQRQSRAIEQQIQQLQAIAPPDDKNVLDPPAEIYFYIGNALFQLGSVDEAVQSWETCRERNPKFPMVHNNLAVAYMKQGRIDDAWAELTRAEELGFPVNPQFKADLESRRGH